MPNYQGQLDGLCGPYAIVNAFELCGIDNAEGVFQTACQAFSGNRWPNLLWEGTYFSDLKKMTKKCKAKIENTSGIKISFPFEKNTPNTNDDYWKKFDALLEAKPDIRCMILGLTRPSRHWIVAVRDSKKRFEFIDTDPFCKTIRKNRKSLFAGSRNGNPKTWLIDRAELVVFEVK